MTGRPSVPDRLDPRERAALRELGEAVLVAETGGERVVRLCTACGSDRHGRPWVVGSTAAVSMAYAPGLVAVAWSWEGRVGIDIAPDGPPVAGVGDRRSWTRAEALLKWTGDGLRGDPDDLPDIEAMRLDLPAGYVGSVLGRAVSWRLAGPAAAAGPATR